jgi:signal transduction histidine kinase/CheY-like chemotaxis protein
MDTERQVGTGPVSERIVVGEPLSGVLPQSRQMDEAAFEGLFGNYPQPVWLTDRVTLRILLANDAALKAFGMDRSRLLFLEETALCPPEDAGRLLTIHAASPSVAWVTWTQRHRRPGGTWANVEVNCTGVWFNGRHTGISVAQSPADIELDVAGNARATMLQSVADNAGCGLGRYCLARKRLIFANPVLRELLGVGTPEEGGTALSVGSVPRPTTGRQIDFIEQVFVSVEEWANFLDAVSELQPFHQAVLWRSPGGGRRHVDLSGVPTETPYGIEVDISVEDITESIRAEQQMQQSHKMEALGRMAGGVAHDFNNLLLVIRGHAEMLEDTLSKDSDLRRHTTKLLAAARQAADITGGLLTFSRSEEKPQGPLALNQTLRGYAQLIPSLLHTTQVLDLDLAAEELHVLASGVHIQQLLLNLCVNARDAMPDGGRLTVRTRLCQGKNDGEKGSALLEVSDTGTGMDAETRAHIFEPFYTTKTRGKGTGLGLALVYGIVNQYNGTIEVDSELGRGTSFRIMVPLVAHTLAETTGEQAKIPGHTVLLVDDELEIRNMVSDFLRMQGHTVLAAGDAEQAMTAASSHQGVIDLLITDVVMPHTDGFELAIKLRKQRPEMPILVMSGFTGGSLAKRGKDLGEVPFLSKPFSLRQLESSLKDILGPANEIETITV